VFLYVETGQWLLIEVVARSWPARRRKKLGRRHGELRMADIAMHATVDQVDEVHE